MLLRHFVASAKDWVSRTPVRGLVVAARHRGLRDTDCFLASYPKSGNTWLRHVMTHALTGVHTQWIDSFREYSIGVGKHHDLIPTLPGDGRLIKTHEPYRHDYCRAVLMIRDPRDVAVSQFHYNKQYSDRDIFRDCTFEAFVDLFLAGKTSRYGDWGSHGRSWNDAIDEGRIVTVRYEDMKQEPVAALNSVLDFLKIDVDAERRQQAVEDNTAPRMREKERSYRASLGKSREEESKRTFVRAAKTGSWRELFTRELEGKLLNAFGDVMQKHGYKSSDEMQERN